MSTFAFDDFTFDDVRYELSRNGTVLRVDTQVLELLAYLLKNPARLVTKDELIAEVWQGRALGDNVISVCVAKLRKALGGAANRCITNVYGRGYRFLRPVSLRDASAAPEVSALPPQRPPVLDTLEGEPYVGRTVALGRLHGALSRARTGRGGACALLGEAGIGKTRSAEVLEAQAIAAGFRVSWGRCHVFGDAPPLWPWLQIVRSCESQLPAALIAQPYEALMQGADGDADPDEPRGPGSFELKSRDAWRDTLHWMTTVASRVSAVQPWLIVLEDVQWADAATLALLAHVIAEAAQLRVLLVLTARDTELPGDPLCKRALDYVLGHRGCERIELSRLQESDIAAYISRRFGAVDPALQRAVFAKSEGNPFFMVELLRPWVDGPRPAVSELTLSGYALDIIRQALRRLDASALEVLSAASVVGRSFDLGMLSAVTQQSGEQLIETLEEAMSSNVIAAERESHTRFVFGHDLIRHVLYEDLASLIRTRLHQRVAEALAARESASGPMASAELAHHLLSALPSGDIGRAISSAREAAFSATRVGAYADACAFLRRALEALRLSPDADPYLACSLLYDLARCERAAGEPFAQHFEEAVQLALNYGYGEVLFSAGQRMSQSPGTVAMPGADTVLEAALAAIPATDARRRSIVLAHLTWTPPHCRDTGHVQALLEEAETLAERSTDSAKRAALRAKLYFAGGPDDYERAVAIARQLENMATHRDPMKRALWSLEPLLGRVIALLQRGEFSAAQSAIEGFGAAAKELHHAELIWHYERMCVVMRMNSGDYAFARTRLAELKADADRLQLHARKAVEAVDWGELMRQTTDIKPFAAQFARGLSAADPSDNPNVQASKLRMLVQFGLLDEARAALRGISPESLQKLPKSRDYLAVLSHIALASVATQSRGHLEVLYELLKPYPNFCVAALSVHVTGVVSHYLAILAHGLNQRARALEHFEHAIALQERLGLQPQLARSRYDLGAMLVESAERTERERGRATLEAVHEQAGKLGLAPLRAAANELLLASSQASRAAQ